MKKSVVISIVVVAMLMADGDAFASRRRSVVPAEEIEGIVARISSSSLTVRTARRGDVEVLLTSETRIFIDDHRADLANIRLGDEAEIYAKSNAAGQRQALVVKIEADDEELKGIVKSLTPASLTVTTEDGDITLLVTAETKIIVQGARASLSDVRPGDGVVIHALRRTDGNLTAEVIVVRAEVSELDGIVMAVGTSTMTVRGENGETLTFTVRESTLITIEGRRVPLSSVASGAEVEVKYLRDGAILIALKIEIDDDHGMVEIEGVVTDVSATFIHVRLRDGQVVAVQLTPETIVRHDDRIVPLSEIKAGDRVEIKAMRNDRSELVAIRVEIEDHDDDDDDELVEIEGKIVAISGSALTIRTEGGHDVTVLVDSRTVIRKDDRVVDVSALRLGDKVEVEARRNADGSLVAVKIEIEEDDDDADDD